MAQFFVLATYTAEDGLADLEQRGPFETRAEADEIFTAYKAWADYRDVELWDGTANKRIA